MLNVNKKGLPPASGKGQQTTTESIIPNNRIMNKVEFLLGKSVDPKYYRKALKYAKHKLKWQGERYGLKYDNNYLAKVTSEVYNQQMLTEEMIKLGGIAYEINNRKTYN